MSTKTVVQNYGTAVMNKPASKAYAISGCKEKDAKTNQFPGTEGYRLGQVGENISSRRGNKSRESSGNEMATHHQSKKLVNADNHNINADVNPRVADNFSNYRSTTTSRCDSQSTQSQTQDNQSQEESLSQDLAKLERQAKAKNNYAELQVIYQNKGLNFKRVLKQEKARAKESTTGVMYFGLSIPDGLNLQIEEMMDVMDVSTQSQGSQDLNNVLNSPVALKLPLNERKNLNNNDDDAETSKSSVDAFIQNIRRRNRIDKSEEELDNKHKKNEEEDQKDKVENYDDYATMLAMDPEGFPEDSCNDSLMVKASQVADEAEAAYKKPTATSTHQPIPSPFPSDAPIPLTSTPNENALPLKRLEGETPKTTRSQNSASRARSRPFATNDAEKDRGKAEKRPEELDVPGACLTPPQRKLFKLDESPIVNTDQNNAKRSIIGDFEDDGEDDMFRDLVIPDETPQKVPDKVENSGLAGTSIEMSNAQDVSTVLCNINSKSPGDFFENSLQVEDGFNGETDKGDSNCEEFNGGAKTRILSQNSLRKSSKKTPVKKTTPNASQSQIPRAGLSRRRRKIL